MLGVGVAESTPVRPDQGLTLSRWSRLKRAAAEEQAGLLAAGAESVDAVPTPEKGQDEVMSDGAVNAASTSRKYDELPPISSISLAEDFTPFMQSAVPQALKRQALKALFKEPHFNVMDGLDIYIDDYTVFEPISPEVMATLSSWKTIMNPPQQVVTPDGYAVDVQSEEGRAVLAAQAELAQADAVRQLPEGGVEVSLPALRERAEGNDQAPLTLQTSDPSASDASLKVVDAAPAAALTPTLSRAAGEGAKQHIRYGKRVGDFSASAYVAAEQVALDAASAAANRDPSPSPDPTARTATKNIT